MSSLRVVALTMLVSVPLVVRAQDMPAPAPDPTKDALAEQNRELKERMRKFEEQLRLMQAQLTAVQAAQTASAPVASPYKEPYAWGDFTWLNGSSRQTTRTLDNKWFTPQPSSSMARWLGFFR